MALTPGYANSVEFSFSFFSKMKKKAQSHFYILCLACAREMGSTVGKKEGNKEKRKRRVGEGGSEVSERASEK